MSLTPFPPPRRLALMLHALTEGAGGATIPAEHRPFAIPRETLVRGLEPLLLGGWRILDPHALSLDPADPAPGEGAPVLPELLLTFDDSWEQHRTVALPLLAERGWRAAAFLTIGQLGEAGMLDGSGVRALAEAGWLIGAHGASHAFLSSLPTADLRRELREGRERLQALSGQPVEWLSLPGGRGGVREVEEAHALGYRVIFGSVPGWLAGSARVQPRLALRAGDAARLFAELGRDPQAAVLRQGRRAFRRQLLRALLGEEVVHRLYRLWQRLRGD